jgi:hypothetical protein
MVCILILIDTHSYTYHVFNFEHLDLHTVRILNVWIQI